MRAHAQFSKARKQARGYEHYEKWSNCFDPDQADITAG